MGAAASTAFPQDLVVACCIRVVNVFGPIFVRALAISVLDDQAKASSPSSRPASAGAALSLQRPPVATEPLERGWLTKLGDVKKNWKKRFFVATEEAGELRSCSVRVSRSYCPGGVDNFVIYYFESEKDAHNVSKAKGCIHPCGYQVKALKSESEVKTYGEFCLALTPLDRKRTWYLRCDSEEQQMRWKLVLRYASLKCQAPLSADKASAAAFREAYARTRRQLELPGFYAIDRPEAQQLAVLCAQACEESVLHEAYTGIFAALAGAGGGGPVTGASAGTAGASSSTSGSSAGKPASDASVEVERIRAQLDGEVDRIAREVCSSAWPAILARAELQRDFLQRQVSGGSLATLLTERESRRAAVRQRLRAAPLLDSALDASARASLMIVLGALLKPQYKARGCSWC